MILFSFECLGNTFIYVSMA